MGHIGPYAAWASWQGCEFIEGKIVPHSEEYDKSPPSGIFGQVWVYDTAGDRWESGPEMNVPRHGSDGVTINKNDLRVWLRQSVGYRGDDIRR